jgi:hypothetical protein
MSSHTHSHHALGPSYPGSVVLDVGADIGALVVYTSADRVGDEIEITAELSDGPVRTHSAVRERRLDGHTLHCAVYPGLREGMYTIWRDEHLSETIVRVIGGEVAQYHWRDA